MRVAHFVQPLNRGDFQLLQVRQASYNSFMIDLNPQQRQAVQDGEPVRIVESELGQEVVVVRADLFDSIRDMLQEERERKIIAKLAMRNALGRADERP